MLPITLPTSIPFPALGSAVPLVLFVETVAGCGVGLAVGSDGSAGGIVEGTRTLGISLWAIGASTASAYTVVGLRVAPVPFPEHHA